MNGVSFSTAGPCPDGACAGALPFAFRLAARDHVLRIASTKKSATVMGIGGRGETTAWVGSWLRDVDGDEDNEDESKSTVCTLGRRLEETEPEVVESGLRATRASSIPSNTSCRTFTTRASNLSLWDCGSPSMSRECDDRGMESVFLGGRIANNACEGPINGEIRAIDYSR